MSDKTQLAKIWDKVGICASGLCLVHCLVTPILLIIFPGAKIMLGDNEIVHSIFAIFVVLSIGVAVYPTCKEHGHKDIIISAVLGVIFILGGIFLHETLSETMTHIMTIIGSIFLIIAHLKNMKVRHGKCDSDSNDHCHSSH